MAAAACLLFSDSSCRDETSIRIRSAGCTAILISRFDLNRIDKDFNQNYRFSLRLLVCCFLIHIVIKLQSESGPQAAGPPEERIMTNIIIVFFHNCEATQISLSKLLCNLRTGFNLKSNCNSNQKAADKQRQPEGRILIDLLIVFFYKSN